MLDFAKLYELEMSVIPVLNKLERYGLRWDSKLALRENRVIERKMQVLLNSETMSGVNPNSPKQVKKHILGLGVPEKLLMVKGKITTAAEVVDTAVRHLQNNEQYESIDRGAVKEIDDFNVAMTDYRHLAKVSKTYLVPFSRMAMRNDGIIFVSINPTSARTGRMGGTGQQFSKPKESSTYEQRVVRRCVVCRDGCAIYCFDFCLVGSTKIATPFGDRRLNSLKIGDSVYSWNPSTEKISFEHVVDVRYKGRRDVWRIILDNGEEIVGTPEHKLYRYDGSKIEMRYLKPGDRLLPFRKHRVVGRERLYSKSSFKWAYTYRVNANAVLGERPEGYDTHHIDENMRNDHPGNLEYVPESDHNSAHAKKNWLKQDHTKRVKQYYKGIVNRNQKGDKNPNYGNRKGVIVKCLWCEKERYFSPCRLKKFQYARESFCSKLCADKAKNQGFNRKVVVSESLRQKQNVYNLETTGHHNYALSAGVISSNCQMEMAVFGMLAGVPLLLDAYEKDEDLHLMMAREIYGQHITEDSPERDITKTTSFSIIYGAGESKIAANLGLSKRQAEELKALYYGKFPEIKAYQKEIKERLEMDGCITDLFGRRYHLKPGEAYKGVNAEDQGLCASVFKRSLVQVSAALRPKLEHLVLVAHDECLVERRLVRGEEGFVMRVKNAMEEVQELLDVGLRLRVECKRTVTNWGDKKSI